MNPSKDFINFTPEPIAQQWLTRQTQRINAVTATLHQQVGEEADLLLIAAIHLPPQTLRATIKIPFGRGMAGAAQRNKIPASTCNLHQQPHPAQRPKASYVSATSACAYPIIDQWGVVLGVLGLAFSASEALKEHHLIIQEIIREATHLLGDSSLLEPNHKITPKPLDQPQRDPA